MKLEGRFVFDAGRNVVWKALLDPLVLAKAMPGCDRLEKIGENEYQGIMNVRVGPVQGRFQGTVRLSDVIPPDHYRLSVDGRGPTGFMKGDGLIRLSDDEEGRTAVEYSVEAQVGGRIASVGQRLIDTTAKSITRQSLETLNSVVKAQVEGVDLEAIEAPSATRLAAGVAKDMVKDMARRLGGKKDQE